MIARYESFSLLENDLFHTHMNWLSKVQNCTNDQCILPPPFMILHLFLNSIAFIL